MAQKLVKIQITQVFERDYLDDDQLNVSNSIHLDDLSFFDEYYDEYYSKIGYYEYESLNQHMQIHSSRKKKKTFKKY